MKSLVKRLGTKRHGSTPDNNTQHSDNLLYVDDGVSLADLEDNLQLSLHNVNTGMLISR
jgi:hypothetical protein